MNNLWVNTIRNYINLDSKSSLYNYIIVVTNKKDEIVVETFKIFDDTNSEDERLEVFNNFSSENRIPYTSITCKSINFMKDLFNLII